MNSDCFIALFGGLSARFGARHIVKFRTRSAAFLLARLALEPQFHRRAALIEWLWPDCELAVGRNRLSVTLSELRRALGDVGQANPLLLASHDAVRLDGARVTTDVAGWEALLHHAHNAPPDEEIAALRAALVGFGGWLLAGYDDDYFAPHERRLNAAFGAIACRLETIAPHGDAFVLAQLRRAATFNPHSETVTRAFMRAQGGEDALRYYAEFESLVRHETGALPDDETRRLARELRVQRDAQTSDFSPANSSHGAGALPAPQTRLFGRDREIEWLIYELTRLFQAPAATRAATRAASERLLCFTGAPGAGKTRLVVEAARRFGVAWTGAIVFVALNDVRDARRLPDTLRIALGLPPCEGKWVWQRVLDRLRARPTLLIFDGFEHLIEGGAPQLEKLRKEAPQTVCLVTSRRALKVAGEREIAVMGLALPAAFEGDVEELAGNASAQLFLDRAKLVRPDLALNPGNARSIGELCRLLEGVPLTIELAAARAAALSPAQMLEAIAGRLKFLRQRVRGVGAGDFEPRHQSIRATLSWSYELLPPDLARLLTELSAFRGGWTLHSARAVGREPREAAPFWWPEAHELLLEHSLIKAAPTSTNAGDEPRFELSEPLRQFAAEKLSQASRRALERRHARYFLELFENATSDRQQHNGSAWLPALARESANLRAALEWALRHDAPLALRLVAAAWWFWFLSGALDEGRDWLKRALENYEDAPAEPPAFYAGALCGAGFLAWRQGDITEAARFCERSLALFRALDDRSGIVYSLIPLQLSHLIASDYDAALACCEECDALCRELDDQYGLAFSRHLAGGVHERTGDCERAWSLQQQSLALFEVLGAREGVAYALFNRGSVERRRGNWEAALQSCEQSQQIFEAMGVLEGTAYARLHGALALLHGQNAARCGPLFIEALGDFERLGLRWGVALALEGLAMSALQLSQRNASDATQWWSAARRERERIGAPVPPVDRAAFAAFEAQLRAAQDGPAFEANWEIGRALRLGQAVKRARQSVIFSD